MRQIKFRALKDDISDCNFVYGQLVYDAIGHTRITHVDKYGEGLTFHTCLKGTEGQFTGLLDKNGKEIWEGDIFQVANNHIYTVKYCNGGEHNFEWHGAVFVLWYSDDIFFPFDEFAMANGEVIGNIHENQDLLK